jgi:hypothetical protein
MLKFDWFSAEEVLDLPYGYHSARVDQVPVLIFARSPRGGYVDTVVGGDKVSIQWTDTGGWAKVCAFVQTNSGWERAKNEEQILSQRPICERIAYLLGQLIYEHN